MTLEPSPRPPQIVSLQEVVTGGQGGLGLQQKWVVGELPPHTHIYTHRGGPERDEGPELALSGLLLETIRS